MRDRLAGRRGPGVIALAALVLASGPDASGAQGYLEVPAPNSTQSGIGAISGWHCPPARIEVSIDGGPLRLAGSGTERLDTLSACGRADTGFSLLFNWNTLPKDCFGCRYHHIDVLADGVPFASTTFQVENFGVEFLTVPPAMYTLPNFPALGSTATLQWDESRQNFAIWVAAPLQLSVPGTYYGALVTGAQNPACGPWPPDRVLPVRHGSFSVGMQDGAVSLSVQYADGGRCNTGLTGVEADDSRSSGGYVHALFDGAAVAACPEFPAGLSLRFNGQRLVADSRDLCLTAHVVGAK